jgi:hypothetical protein
LYKAVSSAAGSTPSSLLLVEEMVESTRLRSNGDARTNPDGAARWGDNAPITPATALPIPLKIAAALLGLANGSIRNEAVSLCGLAGGGGLLRGLSSLRRVASFDSIYCVLSVFLCFMCCGTYPTVDRGVQKPSKSADLIHFCSMNDIGLTIGSK